MSQLSDRIRKARRFKYKVENGPSLVLERPTVYDMVSFSEDGYSNHELAARFVIDWEGVRECDIIKGGAAEEIQFDQDTWVEWLDDNGEWWSPIGQKIVEAFREHLERKEAKEKN